MIEIAIKISLITIGFRAITGPKMIFYFMREWLDGFVEYKKCVDEKIRKKYLVVDELKKRHENLDDEDKIKNESVINLAKAIADKGRPNKYNWIIYIFKPIILCCTCMSSIHTLIWYPILTGSYMWEVIPVMLIVATFNTAIWGAIEKLTK